ncbi:MAG: thiamine phosphate synthase [Fibrobacterales bacterium]
MEIAKVHYLTQDGIAGMTHAALAEEACKGGATWVQIRMKKVPESKQTETALAVQAVCKKYSATFIINDNVPLAKEIGADGVHIGKNDMRPDLARKELGPNAIIGATANSLEDAKAMAEFDIDYLGIGPYKFTTTKENLAPVMGAEGVKEIAWALPELPVIAIGGIIPDDIPDVLATGAYGFALCSVVNTATDRSGVMKEIIKKVEQ